MADEAGKPTTIHEFMRLLLADAGFAVIATVVIGAIFASLAAAGVITMILAVFLLILAWLIAFFGSFFIPWNPPRLHRIIYGALLALMMASLGLWERYEYVSPPSAKEIAEEVVKQIPDLSNNKTSPSQVSVNNERLAVLNSLQLIFGREEFPLRIVFDIPNTLQKNIDIEKSRITLTNAGKLDDFKYNNFTEGDGGFIWSARAGTYHFLPSGGPGIDAGPRDIVFLVTTKRYQDAMKTLDDVTNSVLVPKELGSKISEFKSIVNINLSNMTEILNSASHQGDDLFLKNDVEGTIYYKNINNAYWQKFTPLKPKADEIIDLIREYLKDK